MTPHRYRIYIKATPEQVWQGITDPAFTARYFHGTAYDAPPTAGQPYRTTIVAAGRPALDGTIEVCEPPRRLVQTWHVLYDAAMSEEPPSRVEWLITSVGDGVTQVDVVHGDLARSPRTWATVKDGWVWILDGLKTLLETGDVLPEPQAEGPTLDDSEIRGNWHRQNAIEANNSTWELIDRDPRSADETEDMLRRAYAAAYHWARATGRGPANEARAVWLLSKVHLLAGMPDRALHYGDSCLAVCVEHGLADFDLAYALECRARALQALGRTDEAAEEWARAHAVPIADPEDKAIVEADLAVGP
jgi:uncharacterized protein YndB with AHSA1/START domain